MAAVEDSHYHGVVRQAFHIYSGDDVLHMWNISAWSDRPYSGDPVSSM